jgi:ectoine hydroxylase-related dioxygenase (phytanoyl-CoA dioxygenase family)
MNAVARAAAEYVENGFAIIRDVISDDLISEACHHVDWLTSKHPDLRPEHLHHPLIRDDAFWVRLVSDTRLVDIAEHFLGPDVACFTAHYICKPPHDGQPVLWHQDGAYWKLDPMEALTVWLAIDESNIGNGCLRMIPGSHQLPLHEPKPQTKESNMLFSAVDDNVVSEWRDKQGVVNIELRPGDVSIHHPHILHCSEANNSDVRRCGLDIGYISASTRISNDGLYLDPVLVRGRAVAGVNAYRPFPRYTTEDTVSFAGHEVWNANIAKNNSGPTLIKSSSRGESPVDAARQMIRRLREGTVKR